MKKTFQFQSEGKNPDRLLDSLKNEVRKYVKRERARPLPAGVDFWDFACRLGANQEGAVAVHLNDIIGLMDSSAKEGAAQCYVEILAQHGIRKPRALPEPSDANIETN
jgi:hypothetical protein